LGVFIPYLQIGHEWYSQDNRIRFSASRLLSG
jgi:hypothetical protein